MSRTLTEQSNFACHFGLTYLLDIPNMVGAVQTSVIYIVMQDDLVTMDTYGFS